jgi:hypothetical protein
VSAQAGITSRNVSDMFTRSIFVSANTRCRWDSGGVCAQRKWAPQMEGSPADFTQLRGLSPRANLTDRATKLVTTSADRGCNVVSATDPYGRILGFLDRSRYFFFPVAPQLYSLGRVDPVPGPLHLRECGTTGNRTRVSGSAARNSHH